MLVYRWAQPSAGEGRALGRQSCRGRRGHAGPDLAEHRGPRNWGSHAEEPTGYSGQQATHHCLKSRASMWVQGPLGTRARPPLNAPASGSHLGWRILYLVEWEGPGHLPGPCRAHLRSCGQMAAERSGFSSAEARRLQRSRPHGLLGGDGCEARPPLHGSPGTALGQALHTCPLRPHPPHLLQHEPSPVPPCPGA